VTALGSSPAQLRQFLAFLQQASTALGAGPPDDSQSANGNDDTPVWGSLGAAASPSTATAPGPSLDQLRQMLATLQQISAASGSGPAAGAQSPHGMRIPLWGSLGATDPSPPLDQMGQPPAYLPRDAVPFGLSGDPWLQNDIPTAAIAHPGDPANRAAAGYDTDDSAPQTAGKPNGNARLAQELLFAVPPEEIIPTPEGMTPLEELPPGSAGGPGARRPFARSLNDRPEGTPCAYCRTPTTREPGPDQYNGDHIIPRSQGGNRSPENHIDSCRDCNLEKGPRTPEQWYRDMMGLPSRV
jgi:hypothetical protein